ncbi:hypothetical protein IEQ34_020550 [Dendrobium chrysotoxum]|uniref:Myb-like domain-containing protein n=1 Tax=Dendrobium chrysotoxum TaxID=161865 RepID=A0AAV7G2A5_DENCH|nr:hypothetical protein IEQ34_020550 [Dendrobium chrysotoxum]
MSRKNKSSRRSRGSSKNPQQPPPSDERPPPPRKTKPPPRLLPPLLEKQSTAEEIWALMIQTERSYSMDRFSDTPEYWNSIAQFFPGSSAEKLRKIHWSIIDLQRTIVPWKKDEVQILIASVYGYIEEPEDTPQWWGEIASNLPRRTALDCRVAYNTYGLSRWLSNWRPLEMRQPVVPSSRIDAVITSSERTSIEPPKSKDKEKEQQEETREPSVPKSTMDAGDTSTQRAPEVAAKTKPKGKKKKKKKKKQQEETMEPSVPSSTIDAGGTSTNRTSEVPLMALSKGKEKQQQEETSDQSAPSITMDAVGTSSDRTSEAAHIPKTTSKDKKKLQRQEEMRQHSFAGSKTYPEYTSSQKILAEIPKATSKGKENLQQQEEMRQHTFASGATFPGGTSSQRSFVELLKKWKLEDYIFLMKALTSNLHVDTDNVCAMENIASRIGGKTGDEVRHLILKWRPQLLAALEKADRITGSASGTKDLETSDSSEE